MENNYQLFFPSSSSFEQPPQPQLPQPPPPPYHYPNYTTNYSNNIPKFSQSFTTSSTTHDLHNLPSSSGNSVVAKENSSGFELGFQREDLDRINSNKKKKKSSEKKIRKQRFAFQTRSQVDILDDGYRWRKYGQKAVKNNKFPRSYYRCTHQGCNVKKQVQRLTKDEGVVVTTYEGMHSHLIEKPTDNFENILSQLQIYTPF